MNALKKALVHTAVGGMKAIYLPLKALPSKKKVTFISRQSDTPSRDIRILEKAIKERWDDCQVVVLSKRLTPSVDYVIHLIKQMYHLSTSRTVILDSYSIPVSVLKHKKDLRVIQMWHAIGSMKCFGYAMIGKEEGRDPDIARILKMHQNYDLILISSMDFIKDYVKGFGLTPQEVKEKVREIPLPKMDYLSNHQYMLHRRHELFGENPKLAEKKNILYCPTFRKDVSDYDVESVKALLDSVNFDKYNVIYKPHPLSQLKIDDERIITGIKDNIDAISVSDFVITDYSSIMYEAGIAGKPIYLYAYDWDNYSEKRELNIDLQKEVPAIFTGNPNEIVADIESGAYDYKALKKFINKNAKMPSGGSAVEAILDLIKI